MFSSPATLLLLTHNQFPAFEFRFVTPSCEPPVMVAAYRFSMNLSMAFAARPNGGRNMLLPLIRLCKKTPFLWENVWNPYSP